MTISEAEARLAIVETVADVLFEVAVDGDKSLATEEMLESMKQVADLVIETLDLQVTEVSTDTIHLTVSKSNLLF